MVWGCVSALGKGNLHFCDGTLMLKVHRDFWSTICCLQEDIFSRDVHAYFNKTMQNHHSAHITKSWLRRKRVRVLDWPACSPRPVSNRECVAHFEAQNADTKTPYFCPPLRLVCRKEWDKITPETLHHLVSSVPKRLLSVVKRNGNITKW